jgi:hypothetical protein
MQMHVINSHRHTHHGSVQPLVLILAVLVSFHTAYASHTKTKQARPQTQATTQPLLADPTDTHEVIRIFGSLPSDSFRTWLAAELPLPVPIDETAFARAAQRAQINIVTDPQTCERLQQQALPILKLFNRENRVRFVVYYDSYPQLQTLAHNHLAISTGLLQILKTDAQLNGLVAHELAREIKRSVFQSAWADHDLTTLRQMELFYDAVATLALKAINFSPEDYAVFLQRMINYNVATSSSNNTLEYNRHPTLQDRQRVIRQIDLKHSPVTHITITELQTISLHN